MRSKKRNLFPKIKAHPDQAGFFRRFAAFGVDMLIVSMLASMLYTAMLEASSRFSKDPEPVRQVIKAIRNSNTAVVIPVGSNEKVKEGIREYFLEILKERLAAAEYAEVRDRSAREIMVMHGSLLGTEGYEERILALGEGLHFFQEFFVAYIYFMLFFRFGGRTPGKRLLGLRIFDLEGKVRLGWYQCFERTHGYAASALAGLLGFFQVLWSKDGLTMHDKLAQTTVIKSPKRNKTKSRSKRKGQENEGTAPIKEAVE